MKPFALAAALLLAAPASAQDVYLDVPGVFHTLFGASYHGSAVSPGESTAEPQYDPRNPRYGQSLHHGHRSMDRRGMRIELVDPRSSAAAKGGIGGFIAKIRDLGDQGRKSPGSITLRKADGTVIDRVRVAGGSTPKWNGNTRTVTFAGWIPGGSYLEVKAGPGKMNRPGKDRGAKGQGDGFSVRVGTIPDCPPNDDDKMHVRTERKATVDQAPTRDRGGKSGGKGRK
jgi:hypothetical protein